MKKVKKKISSFYKLKPKVFSAHVMVDSIQDLNRCFNMILVDSNIDEMR